MAVKTIVLKGTGIRKEAKAIATITPGELVELAPTGVQRHSTAAGNASPTFAVENELFGKEITVDYLVNEVVLYEALSSGAEVFALLAASSGAVVVGSYLESAGDGSLRILTAAAATTEASRSGVIARAIEAVTPGGSKTRAKVEVL